MKTSQKRADSLVKRAPRRGAPKASSAAAAEARSSSSSSSSSKADKEKTKRVSAADDRKEQQKQRKNKVEKPSTSKKQRAPILKGPLLVPDFAEFDEGPGAPGGPEAPEALRDAGETPLLPHHQGSLEGVPKETTAKRENGRKLHFWQNAKNRRVLRALQRHLSGEEGEGGPPPTDGGPPEGAPGKGLQAETHKAAALFLRSALMASAGRHRKGTSFEKMKRAKPTKQRRF
ncbi:hypothetical protein Efla_002687 [Eimeria flavescens]